MRICIIVLLLSFILSQGFSYADSPREDFYNDHMVAKAITDIGKMSREEIEIFIIYLASCNVSRGGQLQEYHCDRDTAIYQIKYERGRSIDRVMNILPIVKMWMNASDKTALPDSKEKEEINKAVLRYVDIAGKLKEAANRAFRNE